MYYTIDKQQMKKINTLAVLNVIRNHGPISKIEIARILSLTPATVSSHLKELENHNLVVTVCEGDSTGGRKPILHDLNDKNIYAISISMRRVNIEIGLLDLKGNIIDSEYIEYGLSRELPDVMSKLDVKILNYIDQVKSKNCEILGIGIIFDGLIDSENGFLHRSRDFPWRELSFGEIMEKRYDIPVFLNDFGSAMALAEKYFGGGFDCENFVHVHIGEGVYTGVYIRDRLYSGFNFCSCNVAHHRVSSANMKCFCGKSGCFEVMASYNGIISRFINRLEGDDISKLMAEVQYDLSQVNADMIYSMAVNGDNLAQQVIRDTGRYIGRGLGAIVNMINPEKIFISGVYTAHNIMNRNINKFLAHSSMDRNLYKVKVTQSGVVENIFLISAGAIVVDALMQGSSKVNFLTM